MSSERQKYSRYRASAPLMVLVAGLLSMTLGMSALASPQISQQMVPLDDAEMGTVVAQDGIMFDIRSRNNVDASNNPIGCSGLLNPCRMGLEFTDRPGKWLMIKDFYGTLNLNSIRLDATSMPAANTPYYDPARFLASDGVTCLVPGCNPNGDLAMMLTYPTVASKAPGVYDDMVTFLNIGRLAIEFDAGATPGYMLDNNPGSVFAYRASDSSATNADMRIRFDGRAMIYGF